MPESTSTPPPIPVTVGASQRFDFIPMTDGVSPGAALNALLKRPGSLIYQLHQARPGRLVVNMAVATLICLLLHGLTLGSFSGGTQWWAAPVKTIGGTFLSALLCLPSLYIFTCLSGTEVRLGSLCGVLLAALCLNALLLVGFAPVAWVFSQSTNSVAFIGTIHLVFWSVSMLFALRLLAAQMTFLGGGERGYLRLWFVVFILVCLQMTTALRPLVGQSDTLLPKQRLFFLSHWFSNLGGDEQR